MYEKILVAIDESHAAERVLAAAEELAKLSSSEIWLLHIWEGEPSITRSLSVRSCEDTHSWLKAAAEKLAASGITAHPVVIANLYAYAAREIANFAVANRNRRNCHGFAWPQWRHRSPHWKHHP